MRNFRIDVFLTAYEAPTLAGRFYEGVHEFNVQAHDVIGALEVVFDLTNHPTERDPLYTRRSVSVGDHLVVEGRDHYLCCNMGWRLVTQLPERALTLSERFAL